ncbi:MAG: DUF2490 domain-containing protein [Crocinitomicaceae bacterium]
MQRIHLVALLFTLLSSVVNSQNEIVTRDLESWSTVSLNYDYSKEFDFDFEQSFRLYDNSTKIDQFFTNINMNRKWENGMFFTGGFRFISDPDKDDGDYDFHLRWNADIGYRHSLDRFKFNYRMRLQTKNELGYSRSEGDFSIRALRIRAGVKYNIKNWKLDPQVSFELFRESGRYIVSSFNKYRISVSTKYKFSKLIELKGFYRFERGLGMLLPQNTNIIGFNLTFNL